MSRIRNFAGKMRLKISGIWTRFKSLSWKKKLTIILILIIVTALVIRAITGATKDPGYTTAVVKIGTVSEMVSESGNITTTNNIDIYSPTNGIVTQINVKNGDPVTKNQVLFQVESTATEQEKKAAEANYLAAVSALNSVIATRDSLQASMFSTWQAFKETAESSEFENSDGTPRNEQRAEPEFHIAEKNWLAAEKNYKNAQTAIAQAQASVNSSKLLLDATKDASVKATTDGVVENISVTPGSAVSINQVLSPVQPVLTIVGWADTEVAVELGESEVIKVEPGQEVDLDITSVDGKKYKGEIVRVDSVGSNQEGVIRYTAYIKVIDSDNNLRQGMSVDADIKTNEVEDVLVVPNSAVKPYQGGRAVRVVGNNGEIEFLTVKIGIRGTEYTQVIEGLSEGQEVVTALSNESIKRPGLF
jgi:RND family efflux transporter MFP subunit